MHYNKLGSVEYLLAPKTNGANPFRIFEDAERVSRDVLSFAIKRMQYSTFLGTAYWFGVSSVAKARAGARCQVCNSSNSLNVHHRTYATHGSEHLNMLDLVVLCENCHGLFHGHVESRRNATPKLPKNFIVPHTPEEVKVPDSDFITLTEDLIRECRTCKGGLTNETIRALGVRKRDMKKGWIKRLENKVLTREEYKRAVEGKFMYRSGAVQ